MLKNGIVPNPKNQNQKPVKRRFSFSSFWSSEKQVEQNKVQIKHGTKYSQKKSEII